MKTSKAIFRKHGGKAKKKAVEASKPVQAVIAEEPIIDEPIVTVVALEKQAEPINLNHFRSLGDEFESKVEAMAHIKHQLSGVNEELSKIVATKFVDGIADFSDIPGQVEEVKKAVTGVSTLAGMLCVLKGYKVEGVFKNSETGYRQPLDQRIVKMAEIISSMIDDVVEEKMNVYPKFRIKQKEEAVAK